MKEASKNIDWPEEGLPKGFFSGKRSHLIERTVVYALMVVWCLLLVFTFDAYVTFYIVFLICGCIGFYLACKKRALLRLGVREKVVGAVFSVSFGVASYLANYANVVSLLDIAAVLVGGSFVGAGFLCFLMWLIKSGENRFGGNGKDRSNWNVRRLAFFVPFLVLVFDYVFCLLVFGYPGYLTSDSISQIQQVLTGVYSNHHPVWHTIPLGWCIGFGLSVFGDINVGVATFCFLQSVFMAVSVAYSVSTIRRAGLPRWTCVVVVVLFALLPYHIAYSSTVWKNVPFACCVLLFSAALFRLVQLNYREDCFSVEGDAYSRHSFERIRSAGWSRVADYMVLVLSGAGMGLLQHNGWFALLGVITVIVILLKGRLKSLKILIAVVLATTFLLQNVALPIFGVTPISERESISIPTQQIARVVVDEEISEEETRVLQYFIDVESIAELYNPHLSDPVKWSINEEYYEGHKVDFFSLWFRLGLEHPVSFLKAWIDQTKGYWFGGYDYWIVADGVTENDLGIQASVSPEAKGAFLRYSFPFFHFWLFQPLISIGLAFWLVVGIAACSVILRKPAVSCMALPALMVIATLFVSTPVFCEFRYAYSLYMVLPALFFLAMAPPSVRDDACV